MLSLKNLIWIWNENVTMNYSQFIYDPPGQTGFFLQSYFEYFCVTFEVSKIVLTFIMMSEALWTSAENVVLFSKRSIVANNFLQLNIFCFNSYFQFEAGKWTLYLSISTSLKIYMKKPYGKVSDFFTSTDSTKKRSLNLKNISDTLETFNNFWIFKMPVELYFEKFVSTSGWICLW